MKEYLSRKLNEIHRELETIDMENCDIPIEKMVPIVCCQIKVHCYKFREMLLC